MLPPPLEQATPQDASAIAALHVAVWRLTYAGLAPADAFNALDERVRLPYWAAALADPERQGGILVARDRAGGLAGFGMAGRDGHPAMGGRGEIKHLYVAAAAQGQGVGRALLGALMRHLAGQGAPGAALGVVDGNAPAIAFYERLGGVRIGAYTDPGPRWRSRNLVYAGDWAASAAQIKPILGGIAQDWII